MWGIKLKGFIRQVDLSYLQGYDDDGEEGKEDNVKCDKDDMNNRDNKDENISYQLSYIFRTTSSSQSEWWWRVCTPEDWWHKRNRFLVHLHIHRLDTHFDGPFTPTGNRDFPVIKQYIRS